MEAARDLEEEKRELGVREVERSCARPSFSAAALANAQQGLDQRDRASGTDAEGCFNANEALKSHEGLETRGRLDALQQRSFPASYQHALSDIYCDLPWEEPFCSLSQHCFSSTVI